MEVAVHVEADDAEVVGAGHVGDDALATFPLLGHSHPHVPVPQLQRRPTTHLTCQEEAGAESEDANC